MTTRFLRFAASLAGATAAFSSPTLQASSAHGQSKGSGRAAPRPFLEAAPLLDLDHRKGEAPRQFLFTLFGDKYICERSYRDAPGGSNAGAPTPTPEPELEVGRVSVLCDGENKLVLRHAGKTVESEKYSFASECREAAKEFRENAGCFCGPNNGLACVERGFVVTRVGAPFAFVAECRAALKGLDRGVEIRFKAPAR